MALTDIASDRAFVSTRFLVIDFEALTPAGRAPESVEVAAVVLECSATRELIERTRFESLLRPPADVRMTWRDERRLATA